MNRIFRLLVHHTNHYPYCLIKVCIMLRCGFFFMLCLACRIFPADATPIKEINAEKILLVTLQETGLITVGNDMVGSDELARYIQERLFKSYMGTGLMHHKIKLVKTDPHIPDLVTDAVINEIKEGQKRALTELCLQKHRKLYENLSPKQQEKLKKQFPVLFQTNY